MNIPPGCFENLIEATLSTWFASAINQVLYGLGVSFVTYLWCRSHAAKQFEKYQGYLRNVKLLTINNKRTKEYILIKCAGLTSYDTVVYLLLPDKSGNLKHIATTYVANVQEDGLITLCVIEKKKKIKTTTKYVYSTRVGRQELKIFDIGGK